jgi:hypothetical protein
MKRSIDLGEDLVGAGVGPVDLVDDDDDGEAAREGLIEDEARLGEGALGGVDQEYGAVDHGDGALDLAAEVGVARRVQDVDLHALPDDRAILGGDGDPALALEVHAVHEALGRFLPLAEDSGLPEHGVDEGGLAVVDVGDYGDIADAWVGCVFMAAWPRPGSMGRTKGWPRRESSQAQASSTRIGFGKTRAEVVSLRNPRCTTQARPNWSSPWFKVVSSHSLQVEWRTEAGLTAWRRMFRSGRIIY